MTTDTCIRPEAFKALKKAHEEASVKISEIISEAYNLVARQYQAEAEDETKVNIVDSLNIDLYYEQILVIEFHLRRILKLVGYVTKNITEDEYSFAFQRMNDLMEKAKSNFEKIKYLTSKHN